VNATGLRILIVEDNPLNLELATDILEAAGHTISSASEGRAGVQKAKEQLPDLILMDLRLPDLEGGAALKLLREDRQTAEIPVVALTAQAMSGDEDAARAAGFDGYISKPINTRTFARTVAAYLSRGPGPEPGT